ncbi:hypothetical protein [Streptomyces sp. CA-111067]|uniref:hypothetical protein n=1 Tax=Streptomyces sp. CA-111067 TaxID=3240046 RepID=UPI003D95D699
MTADTATTPAPLLNGQLIGITYHAIAAVRDRLLADSGLTFHQSAALRAAAEGLDRAANAGRLTSTLKIDPARAHALLDGLTEAGLLDPATASLTGKGAGLHGGFTDAVNAVAERLYGGLPAAERETAARALAHVTAMANAELGPEG